MKKLALFLAICLAAHAQFIQPPGAAGISAGGTAAGGAPSGAAGGVLSGTYPNPGFAASPTFSGLVTVLNNATTPAGIGGQEIRLINADSSNNIILADSSGGVGALLLYGRVSTGTLGSPAATGAGNVAINIAMLGFANGALTTAPSGTIRLLALNGWTASDQSTQMTVGLTPSGSNVASTALTVTNALMTVAGGINVGGGTTISNFRHGITGNLSSGTLVVSDTKATANTRYFFTTHTLGTITLPVTYYASARSAGVSFTITSGNVTDTSTVDWLAIEP